MKSRFVNTLVDGMMGIFPPFTYCFDEEFQYVGEILANVYIIIKLNK
jgi:hypothetical protein